MKSTKKDELGNYYGDFRIIAEYPDREPSNGIVKWVGECVDCGYRHVFNGNMLRYGHYSCNCRKCARKKRKRR